MKENQRVALTKRLLQEGLFRLLEEKPLEKVKVTELCREAGINRATFYRHYTAPRDVLLDMEAEFDAKLSATYTAADKQDVPRTIEALTTHLHCHRALLKVFLQNNSADEFLPLASDRLVAVLPEGHPLAQRDSLRLKDVAGENLLLMPPHTYLHKLCLSLVAQAGETPRVAGASRMESLLSQVRAGEGISFFAQANFRLFQTQGLRAVPLEESPSLAVGIAWNKEEKLSPGVQMLLAFFQASS